MRKKLGLTLPELALALGVFGVLAAVGVASAAVAWNAWLRQQLHRDLDWAGTAYQEYTLLFASDIAAGFAETPSRDLRPDLLALQRTELLDRGVFHRTPDWVHSIYIQHVSQTESYLFVREILGDAGSCPDVLDGRDDYHDYDNTMPTEPGCRMSLQ